MKFSKALCLMLVFIISASACSGRKKRSPGANDKIYPVKITAATSGEIPDLIDLEGSFIPSDRLLVKSAFAGVATGVSASLGQNVVAGDTLVKITNDRLGLELDKLKAELHEEEVRLESVNQGEEFVIGNKNAPVANNNTDLGNNLSPDDVGDDINIPDEPPIDIDANGNNASGNNPGNIPVATQNAPSNTSSNNPGSINKALNNSANGDPNNPFTPPLAKNNDNNLFNQLAQKNQTQQQQQQQQAQQRQVQNGSPVLGQAKIDRLKAEIALKERQLSEGTIVAGISGIISKKEVSEGALIQLDNVLYEITDTDPILLQVFVPQKYIGQLNRNIPVKVTDKSNLNVQLNGDVSYISNEFNIDKKGLEVRIAVSNANQNIKANLAGVANLALSNKTRNVIFVPAEALKREGDKAFVYLAKDNLAIKTPVDAGPLHNGQVAIFGGINQDDKVISKGHETFDENEEYIKAE